MRKGLIAGSVLLLSACNMVVSKEPWFTPADAAGSPKLREGLWAALQKPDCKFDPAEAVQDWPACAEPVLVKGDTYSGPSGSDDARATDPSQWDKVHHLLVGGRPMIDQLKMGEGKGPEERGFLYLGFEPSAQDAEGRITAARIWPVVCGPLPPKGKRGAVTTKPFKGLTIDGMACTARDIAALRGAAMLSDAMLKDGKKNAVTLRWLKD